MAKLDTRIRKLFDGEREQAERNAQRVLRMMSRAEKELMMDGLVAEFRGEPEPEGVAEVMNKFESLGGMEAVRRLDLLETDAGLARNAERKRQIAAGRDWRKINL